MPNPHSSDPRPLSAGERTLLRQAVADRTQDRTHCDECYLWRDHRDCAVRRLLDTVERLEAECDRMREAIWRAIQDEESGGGGWGPDNTVCAYLREAATPLDLVERVRASGLLDHDPRLDDLVFRPVPTPPPAAPPPGEDKTQGNGGPYCSSST